MYLCFEITCLTLAYSETLILTVVHFVCVCVCVCARARDLLKVNNFFFITYRKKTENIVWLRN